MNYLRVNDIVSMRYHVLKDCTGSLMLSRTATTAGCNCRGSRGDGLFLLSSFVRCINNGFLVVRMRMVQVRVGLLLLLLFVLGVRGVNMKTRFLVFLFLFLVVVVVRMKMVGIGE